LYSGLDDDLWLPTGAAATILPHCDPAGYKCDFFESVIGRLKPGENLSAAQAELNGLDEQWARIYPDLEKNSLKLYPARGIDPHARMEISRVPPTLIAIVVLLLLIACANVSGLLLARGTARRREIAIRLALGAARGRIVRQLLTEAALLAFLGSAVGAVLLLWASHWLSNLPFVNTEGFRSFYNIGLDWRVAVGALLLTIVTVFVFATMPAIRATKFALLESLNQTTASATERSRSRGILVAGQVALAVVLSAGAVLMVRSLNHVLMGPGFDPSHLAIVRVSPYRLGYPAEKSAAIQTEALRKIGALPGVEAVSFGQLMPWWESWDDTVALPGQNDPTRTTQARVHYNSIAPNYLHTLGIGLLRGREFTDTDRKGTPNVVIVNETLAHEMWPKTDAVGQVMVIGGTECTVVGVAQDAQYSSSADGAHPFFYRPY
jgi:predicted permease